MLGSVQGGKVLAEKEGNRYDGGMLGICTTALVERMTLASVC